MIIYRHLTSPVPPPWLAGGQGLCHREEMTGGYTFGLGEPYEFGRFPAEGAHALADGWECAVVGEIIPSYLYRRVPGLAVVPAEDMQGRLWAAPIVMGPDGARAFQVPYGKGWKPKLTQQQEELMEFAGFAKSELMAIMTDAKARQELLPPACAWAAAALAWVNHIPAEAVEALGLLDETLVVNVLVTMASFQPPAPPTVDA